MLCPSYSDNFSDFETYKWNRLLNRLGKPFKTISFRYEDEIKTTRFIHAKGSIRGLFVTWLNHLPIVTEYDEDITEEFRRRGNVAFKLSRHPRHAAWEYTCAIYTAEAQSPALALAHANRAATLYKLEEYEAAYYDCEMALELGHPKPELILLRQATCASALKDASRLQASLDKLDKLPLQDSKQLEVDKLKNILDTMKTATESAATEPAASDSTSAEVTVSDTMKTVPESTVAESADSDPASAEVTVSESANSELTSTVTASAPSESAPAESAASGASATEETASELAVAEAAAAGPATTETAVSEPAQYDHNFEKKQKILRDASRGRYVVADEPIAPHETIMTEEPFAFVPVCDRLRSIFPLDQHAINFTCSNCAELDVVPFPCYICRNVSYCSPGCREKHSSIHRYECYGYKVDLFLQIGISHLALRCLLVVFDQLTQDVRKIEPLRSFNRAEQLWQVILKTGRDGELMGLCTNNKNSQKDKKLIRNAATASMLCCYLKEKTDFFERTRQVRNDLMTSEHEWEIVVAALLLRLTNQMLCNARTIKGFATDKPFSLPTYNPGELTENIYEASLFSAIYPRASLYNHSCLSNFRNKYDKAKLIVIAVKEIAAGEEIFNCYGIDCRSMGRVRRKEVLRSLYGFNCKCNFCQDGNDEVFFKYNFKICKVATCQNQYLLEQDKKCPKCNVPYDQNADDRYRKKIDKIETRDLEDCENIVDTFFRLNHLFPPQTVSRMDVAYYILTDLLEDGLIDLIPNTDLVKKVLKLAIDLVETTEAIYGTNDFWFLQDSLPLLDLMSLSATRGDRDILKKVDIEKIKGAFNEVFTGRMKKKFEMYFDKYLTN